jgi:hypothetical protein
MQATSQKHSEEHGACRKHPSTHTQEHGARRTSFATSAAAALLPSELTLSTRIHIPNSVRLFKVGPTVIQPASS